MDPLHRPCGQRPISALIIAATWSLFLPFAAAAFPGENTVVRLSVDGRSGTGFIVALDNQTAYVLTAKHVLKNSKWSDVEFLGDPSRAYKAEVQAVDSVDIALLRVANPPASARALAISGQKVEPGTEALVIGFPNRSSGETLAAATFSRPAGSNLSLTGLVGSGSSGSPILLKGCEAATGLVTKARKYQVTAVPGATLLLALENWLPETPLPKSVACPISATDKVRISFPLSPILRKGELYIDGEPAVPEADSTVAVWHVLVAQGARAFEWRRNDGGRCRFARIIREPEVMTSNCTWEMPP